MARHSKNLKRNPYIIVFWEGESEEQYMKYMRQFFHRKVNLTVNPKKGVFDSAKKAFSSKGAYADDVADVDEIWMIFDTGIENGIWSMKRIKDELNAARTDEDKYRILYFTDSTFTNVHEAIEYLKDL